MTGLFHEELTRLGFTGIRCFQAISACMGSVLGENLGAELSGNQQLVYGLGETAAGIMRKFLEDDFIGDFWSMWAGMPNTAPEADVNLWGTDIYPFSERNMTTLSILTRLGDRGADLVVPTILAWRDRVPVEVLFLDPEEEAAIDGGGLAARQWATLSALRGVGLVRMGRTAEDAIRFLEIRSGWNPPEDV